MEKRVLGVILTLLGAVGLVIAGVNFVNRGNGTYNLKTLAVYRTIGLIFFFAGIGLIRNTRDVVKNNEHVS